jgi:hypothetical protein
MKIVVMIARIKITAYGTHWRWQDIQCSSRPNRLPNKELKVQNMNKSPP